MKSEDDPRSEFMARVNFKDTRVRSFSGFLFLCGGEHHCTEFVPLKSVRHLIYQVLTSGGHTDLVDRLRMAEDIQDWFRDGVYSDLVTFEEHLASLASVILLAVESPGSIAELGAFSVLRPISSRLIAIVDEGDFEQDSFIKLGPIKRLENDTQRPVLVHDWHVIDRLGNRSRDLEKLRPEVTEILENVRTLLHQHKGEQVFKTEEPAHVMLLICELCDLFGALSKQEIEQYIHSIDQDFKNITIEQYLFLLEKCSILRIKARGHGRYYYAPDWASHVTFSFRDGQRVDRDRVRIGVVEFYKRHLKSRAEVVRLVRKAS